MATKQLPRGVRENNPGNIRHGDKWQGLAAVQRDPSFCTFEDPTWGVRAIARLLIMYQDKYNIRTITKIIQRWAPAVENDTVAYINQIVDATGFKRDQILDMQQYEQLRPVLEAIIRHENGKGPLSTPNTWYGDDVIKTGLQRAGVLPKVATVAAVPVTREAVGATTAGALGIGQIADVMPAIQAAMSNANDNLSSGQWIRIALGVATIAVAVYIAWSQVKKHKLGVVE